MSVLACLLTFPTQDLHIKTEADVLIVSARQENKTPAGKSYVSKQFEQRFTLPSGVNPERISSKLGVDGVLRVSAPREAASVSYKRPEAVEDTRRLEVGRSGSVSKASEGLPEPRIKYEKDRLEIKIDVSQYSPEDLDVKVWVTEHWKGKNGNFLFPVPHLILSLNHNRKYCNLRN